jgi:hypothetical protein
LEERRGCFSTASPIDHTANAPTLLYRLEMVEGPPVEAASYTVIVTKTLYNTVESISRNYLWEWHSVVLPVLSAAWSLELAEAITEQGY